MKAYTYLFVNLGCLFVPFLFSFHHRYPFRKEWRYFWPANMVVSVSFLAWDSLFVSWGVWGFNKDYLIGLKVLNLPVEEILFFLCIPYACVFTYFVCAKNIKQRIPEHYGKLWLYGFLAFSFIMTLVSHQKLYTAATAIFLFFSLLYVVWKRKDISMLVLSYLLVSPFFFLSNGVLTGSWTSTPIVWYNNTENIGIRLGSIPVEDFFYGFLLILWNVLLYEHFRSKSKQLTR